MSNIYKTPLLKSLKIDEKLGAAGKLIDIEDLTPSLAEKIKNAVDNSDLDFLKQYSDDGKSGGLEWMFNYLGSNSNKLISHGIYISGEKRISTSGGGYLVYYQSVRWNEIDVAHTFEQKTNAFAGYISHHGSTGFNGAYGTAKKIHVVHLIDAVAGGTTSGDVFTPGLMLTPVPDEVITACANGTFLLNTTHLELTQSEVFTPACKSVLYGSSGMPIREPGVFTDSCYNCLATRNYSTNPVEIDALLIAFA